MCVKKNKNKEDKILYKMKKIIINILIILIVLSTANSVYAKNETNNDFKIYNIGIFKRCCLSEKPSKSIKNNFIFIEDIKLPKKHQEYLYKMCKERELDYLKTLAVLKHESQFNSQEIYQDSYGYMQVHKVNHKRLTDTLKTENNPLNPYININWGTFMLQELYEKWNDEEINNEKIKGENFTKLDKYVLSSYNMGIAGFRKYGEATKYIGKVNEELEFLRELIK